MLAIKKRPYNIWSRNIFPFSMEGCSLYAPLWQEDMQSSASPSYDPNHLTCTAVGAGWTNTGRTFDGDDDYVVVGAVSSFNFIHDDMVFSFGMWVKFTDYTAAGNQMLADSNAGASTNSGFILYYNGTNDNLLFVAFNASGGGLTTVDITSSNNIIADNNWHLVVVTGDGTNGALYIDGVVDAGITETITNRANSGNASFALMLGAYNEAPAAGELTGSIGETWIYNRALSEPEGDHIYEVTKGRYA